MIVKLHMANVSKEQAHKIIYQHFSDLCHCTTGKRWHGGRVSDSKSRGPEFDGLKMRYVVSLNKTQ